jgi:uncharacterized coiled-coil DUF342 family protein
MGVQVQELKVELKGVVDQISAQKVTRNASKAEKKELTTKIKEAKEKIKDTKNAEGDVSTLKAELLVLKGQKQSKAIDISKSKAIIIDLRQKKVALRNRIKGIKTKD